MQFNAISAIKEFFGFDSEDGARFRSEWARLGKVGREQFRTAFVTGTLTY
ncbi:hypothetical protein [Acrocarpospora sp. B8E8]